MALETNAASPHYLYKILSVRYWELSQKNKNVVLPAEDDLFIHLATEDQLNKILTKYWSDAPQYILLKLNACQLIGTLKFETNPGGETRYFHLYEGIIPFSAVEEAKIVYRESPLCCSGERSNVVEIGNPVLRQRARTLSPEEIQSPEIQELIQEMRAVLIAYPGVGLAAPQIGKSVQLAIIEDMDHSHLTSQQVLERDRSLVPFHVIINPKLHLDETEKAQFFEGCLSVPHFAAIVPRAKSVRVECLNEKGEPISIHAKGWYARILQHEIDHLNGTLYLDRALLSSLTTEENFIKFWKTKSISDVKKELNCHNE